ncbi:hypothetical protein [Erwinia billingiae]|uniref:hypothetical protein n=1 Tax=Erwinia billingiae TaxID=182337 RepID=UPI00320A2B22
MGTPRFTAEYKEEAVRQITERGYSVGESSPYDCDPASPIQSGVLNLQAGFVRSASSDFLPQRLLNNRRPATLWYALTLELRTA